MKLMSRVVIVPKSYETVYQIIQSSAYHIPKGIFREDSFSMHCAKRFNGGMISLFPVKGTIIKRNHSVEVTLSVCADFSFYLGVFLVLLGIAHSIGCIATLSPRWIVSIGMVVFGLAATAYSLLEEKELLDRLEHKLLS